MENQSKVNDSEVKETNIIPIWNVVKKIYRWIEVITVILSLAGIITIIKEFKAFANFINDYKIPVARIIEIEKRENNSCVADIVYINRNEKFHSRICGTTKNQPEMTYPYPCLIPSDKKISVFKIPIDAYDSLKNFSKVYIITYPKKFEYVFDKYFKDNHTNKINVQGLPLKNIPKYDVLDSIDNIKFNEIYFDKYILN